MSDALSQNPGSERGTTPGSALSIGVGVSSTSLFARRRRFLSLSLLPSTRHPLPLSPSSFLARSHLYSAFILLRHPPFRLCLPSPRVSLPLCLSLTHTHLRNASQRSRLFPSCRVTLLFVELPRYLYMFLLYLLYFAATSDDRILVPRQITPPPARSDYPPFSHHLRFTSSPYLSLSLLSSPPWSLHSSLRWFLVALSVCALSPILSPSRPRLFSIRRGNRCCSGPELVQNRWARATSASRRGVGYPCRFTLLLSFLVPLLVPTPRSRQPARALYIYIYIYIYIHAHACECDGVAARWRWNGAKAKRRDDEQRAAHA